MKIAVVGSFDNYGHVTEWVANALELNGHNVTRIDRKAFDIRVQLGQVDILFFVDCSEDYSSIIPASDHFSQIGIDPIKIYWSLDSHMPYGVERSTNIGRKCDLVICSNYNHGVKVLEKFGIKAHFVPITAEKMNATIKKEEYDVAMIGNPNSAQRQLLWEMLNKYFIAYTGIAPTKDDYVRAMDGCKIVVNQPTEPWDMILNNRMFEGMAHGKLVLQKRLKCDEIERLGFKEGVHFVYWTGFEDLKEKLIYYLREERERKKIAKEGNKFFNKNYRLTQQVEKILNLAKELK